jgi:hypothetical protein
MCYAEGLRLLDTHSPSKVVRSMDGSGVVLWRVVISVRERLRMKAKMYGKACWEGVPHPGSATSSEKQAPGTSMSSGPGAKNRSYSMGPNGWIRMIEQWY